MRKFSIRARRHKSPVRKKDGIKYISASKLKTEFSTAELRAFYESRGVHIYCRSDDIVYVNENYAVIHSVTAGEKKITLNGDYSYRELLTTNGTSGKGGVITVTMKENETLIFELKK